MNTLYFYWIVCNKILNRGKIYIRIVLNRGPIFFFNFYRWFFLKFFFLVLKYIQNLFKYLLNILQRDIILYTIFMSTVHFQLDNIPGVTKPDRLNCVWNRTVLERTFQMGATVVANSIIYLPNCFHWRLDFRNYFIGLFWQNNN